MVIPPFVGSSISTTILPGVIVLSSLISIAVCCPSEGCLYLKANYSGKKRKENTEVLKMDGWYLEWRDCSDALS